MLINQSAEPEPELSKSLPRKPSINQEDWATRCQETYQIAAKKNTINDQILTNIQTTNLTTSSHEWYKQSYENNNNLTKTVIDKGPKTVMDKDMKL